MTSINKAARVLPVPDIELNTTELILHTGNANITTNRGATDAGIRLVSSCEAIREIQYSAPVPVMSITTPMIPRLSKQIRFTKGITSLT